jgi:hypothetical protein
MIFVIVKWGVLFEVPTEVLEYYLDDYHNVFTFTLFLSEGQAFVAWEPYNKVILFLDFIGLKEPVFPCGTSASKR